MLTEPPKRDPLNRRIPLPAFLREIVIVICGLIMAVTPLALWVAWSQPIFFGVLVTCFVAMGILVFMSWFTGSDGEPIGTGAKETGKQRLEGEFFDELQRHLPLVHHHRRLSDPRIHRKMARLRGMIRRAQR